MNPTTHTARVSHPCDLSGHGDAIPGLCPCSGTILPGQLYTRRFVPPGQHGDADWPMHVIRAHATKT